MIKLHVALLYPLSTTCTCNGQLHVPCATTIQRFKGKGKPFAHTPKLLYKDYPIGTNKLWPLYTGGIYMQIQQHRKYTNLYL